MYRNCKLFIVCSRRRKAWQRTSSYSFPSDCHLSHNQIIIRASSTARDNAYGLFAIEGLRKPSDFVRLASNAMDKCNSLRSSSLLTSPSMVEQKPTDVLHLLDEISNTICSVIDASELCRSVHVDTHWRHSAGDAFQMLSEYIAELNADVALYNALLPITSDPTIMANLTEEERRMALGLKREFERDGIHLSDEKRKDLQQRTGHIVQLETMFTENITQCSKTFTVQDREAVTNIIPLEIIHNSVHPSTNSYTNTHPNLHENPTNTLSLSTDSYIPNVLLKYSDSSSLRKQVYMELHTSCQENLPVLDALITQRDELSRRMGFPSYAHRFLSDKMVQNPESVMIFLQTIMERCKAQYYKDMDLLSNLKYKLEGSRTLEPWDMNFYSSLVKYPLFGDEGTSDTALVGHFTLENCVHGMKELVQRLFGIVMTEVPMDPMERWDSKEAPCNLQKFEFYHPEKDTLLGIMYLDLHPREGKYVHSAHFTVRCGCSIRDSTSLENMYQLPTVALVCNLSPSYAHSESHGLLTHSEVETVFHEFGHALHSLLSRTSFQHLSGTRVAMDFVETPSHLMEQFVWDKEFLNIIGRHYTTHEPITDRNMDRLLQSRYCLKAIDIQTQIVHSIFDQTLFGPRDKWSTQSTVDVFASLHRKYNIPYATGTHWFSRFGHLVTYGAGYYSYLYSNIFAVDIWASRNFGLKRQSGTELWQRLLIHGGSKDPNTMLMNLLGREPSVDPFFSTLSMEIQL